MASEAAALADRLCGELRAVRALLPVQEQGASAMARGLAIDRATCQRIVAAISRRATGPESLLQFPGVAGMRHFVAAVARRPEAARDRGVIAAVGAAIDRYEAFLREVGGSQRRLRERIESAHPLGARARGPDDVVAREALFRAAVGLTGRWSEVSAMCHVIRPVPGQPELTESARVRALIGHTAGERALPLEVAETAGLRSTDSGPAFLTLDKAPEIGSTPNSLIEGFCSRPLPRITSHSWGASTVQVVDLPDDHRRAPADIVVGHRAGANARHPATLNPPVGEICAIQNVASRHLIFDTFLHREIARGCFPSLEVHQWMPGVGRHDNARWSTRFPGGPRMELLGQGLGSIATPRYSRYAELVAYLFDKLGWNPAEFVGFRCETSYPIWRAGYCMIFDFDPTGGAPKRPYSAP